MPPVRFEPVDLIRREAEDLRLRPRGHWDRRSQSIHAIIYIKTQFSGSLCDSCCLWQISYNKICWFSTHTEQNVKFVSLLQLGSDTTNFPLRGWNYLTNIPADGAFENY